MFDIDKKHKLLILWILSYKVSILWSLSLIIIIASTIISQIEPFNRATSSVVIFVSFNCALLAMTFSAMKKEDKSKVIVFVILMIFLAIRTVSNLV